MFVPNWLITQQFSLTDCSDMYDIYMYKNVFQRDSFVTVRNNAQYQCI